MSQTAVALLALAALVSVVQWVWTRLAARVDLHLMPACSRRRVHRLAERSLQVQLAAAVLVACAASVQLGALLS